MSVTRNVQTAFDVVDERPVGPLPMSVVYGDNSHLIGSIAPLYLTGSVLDVTYGRGVWWRRFQPEPFLGHDLDPDGIDFRALPHQDSSWDTVCFDPPYIPSRAPQTMSAKVRGDHRGAYGIDTIRTRAELEKLVADGLAECARVARAWVLAKTCDYAENERMFVLGHVSTIAAGPPRPRPNRSRRRDRAGKLRTPPDSPHPTISFLPDRLPGYRMTCRSCTVFHRRPGARADGLSNCPSGARRHHCPTEHHGKIVRAETVLHARKDT